MTAPTNPAPRHDGTAPAPVPPGLAAHPDQPRHTSAYADDLPASTYSPGVAPTGHVDARRSGAPTGPRTIRVRLAAIIAAAAFVLGLGAAMLLGPILGPGPGGPGPGGPGPGGPGPGGPGGTSTGQTSPTGPASTSPTD